MFKPRDLRFVIAISVLLSAVPVLSRVAYCAAADADDARAKTHFTASPRERFVAVLWLSNDTTKTVAAQEEALRIWSRLKLRDVQAQSKAISKARAAKGDATPTDETDFSDSEAAFDADRDEVEGLVRALSPRDDRPMPNAFSLVLGPFRQRLEGVLAAHKR